MSDFLHTIGVLLMLGGFVYFIGIIVTYIPKGLALLLAASVIGIAFLVLLTLFVQPLRVLKATGVGLLGVLLMMA